MRIDITSCDPVHLTFWKKKGVIGTWYDVSEEEFQLLTFLSEAAELLEQRLKMIEERGPIENDS